MTEPPDADPRAGRVGHPHPGGPAQVSQPAGPADPADLVRARDATPESDAEAKQRLGPEAHARAGGALEPTVHSDAEIEQIPGPEAGAHLGRALDPTVDSNAAGLIDDGETSAAPSPAFRADRIEEDADRAATQRREAGGPRFQWPLVLVLVGLVICLVIVATDHFRRGSVLFAGCVVLAFFLRAILSDRDAGWLAVRSRAVDLLCLAFLGLSLSVFALIVPPPS